MRLFARILSFSLGILLLFGSAMAQPDLEDLERLEALITSVAGEDFDGNPCSLTEEQRAEIDRLAEEELGMSLGFSDIPCDELDDRGRSGDNHGGMGNGDLDPDELQARIEAIIADVAGENFSGDPCDLTREQREEIDRRVEEEVGIPLGFSRFPCDRIGMGDRESWDRGLDFDGEIIVDIDIASGFDSDIDADFDFGALEEIILDVAGEDFSGNPCDLTEEQRAEIDRRAEEELGMNPGFSDIPCDELGDRDHSGGMGNGDIDELEANLLAIIADVAGEDFKGNPCDLTEEQRAEIDRRAMQELGIPLGFSDLPCGEMGGWDGSGDHGGGIGNGGINPSELEERFLAILKDVAGDDFQGDPCELTEEQRAEINRRLAEEFGDRCPIQLFCPGDEMDGHEGEIDLSEADFEQLLNIILGVAGEDFNGDPCALTDEQRAEIDRQAKEELGIDLHLAEFPCGDNNIAQGDSRATEQARSVLESASRKLVAHRIIQQSIYPNPATDKAVVSFRGPEGNGKVTVVNTQGQTMIQKLMATEAGENSVELNLETLLPGPYYVVVTIDNFVSRLIPVVVQ